ncbi:MAG: lytic transglycosylase domain-containing protein [Bryobacterales bacterium]|nr:lytic transglycosylase domain-containing protein [Bryobacterales bacterium]
MGICFNIARITAGAAGLVMAASVPQSSPALVTSIVRVDSHSGRLVRGVVVSPGFIPRRSRAKAVPPATTEVGKMIEQAAERYDLDPLLVHSVIEVESNYNPFAVSGKGALGLMQLIPSTARRFGVRNPFDPKENIGGGVRYLKYLSTIYSSDLRLVLAAYNAGEGAVARYNGIPHYPETEQYVYRVGKAYGKRRRAVRMAGRTEMPPAAGTAEAARPVEMSIDAQGRLNLRTR